MATRWFTLAWLQATLLCALLLFQSTLAKDFTYITSTNTQTGLAGWELVYGNTTDRICSGEGYVSSISLGSWYYYRFRGTNVTAYVLQALDAAQLEVFIDDVFQTRISSYNPAIQDVNSCTLYQYNSPILPYAQHVITLYHNGPPPERPNSTVFMRVNKFIHTVPDNITATETTSAPLFTPGTSSLFPLTSPSSSVSDSSPTGTAAASSSPTGAIVGGVVGGVIGLGIMILIIILIFKKRDNKPKVHPPGMVVNQNYNRASLGGGGMHAPMITPLVLPTQQQQGHSTTGNPMSYSNPAQYSPPDQPYNPYSFSIQPQTPPNIPNMAPHQFHHDATPPFNTYYNSGASSTAASTASPPVTHVSSDEKAGGRRPTMSSEHRNTSRTSLNTAPQFSIPSETSNRLSTHQLHTIQQMVERGVPASTLATIVDSMINSRGDELSPSTGAPPPAYASTSRQ